MNRPNLDEIEFITVLAGAEQVLYLSAYARQLEQERDDARRNFVDMWDQETVTHEMATGWVSVANAYRRELGLPT